MDSLSLIALFSWLNSFLLLGAFGALVYLGFRWFPGVGRVDLGLASGLALAGGGLRWFLPHHTLIHENHHAYYLIELVTRGVPGSVDSSLLAPNHFLLWGLRRDLGVGIEGLLAVNCLSSTAAILGLYALARLLFRSRIAAWTSATLLVAQPLAIALAPTEEPLVFASGPLLVGFASLVLGAREQHLPTVAAGGILVALGASVREIALPLTLAVPLLVLLSQPSKARWWSRTVLTAAAAVMVGASHTAARILMVISAQGSPRDILGAPSVILGLRWVGWQDPYVPSWMAWAVVAGIFGLLQRAAATRRWRPAAAALGCFVLAQAAGGLVVGGFFPSHLRHQSFAMALMPLLAGGGVAWTEGIRFRVVRLVPWVLVPLLALGTLATHRDGYRWDVPHVLEYRLLAETMPALEPGAEIHVHAPPGGVQTLAGWVKAVRPDLSVIRLDDRRIPEAAGDTSYLLLDRSCHHRAYWEPEALLEPTPFGPMRPACRALLERHRWVPTASAEVTTEGRPLLPAPALESSVPAVTVAVLRRERSGPSSEDVRDSGSPQTSGRR